MQAADLGIEVDQAGGKARQPAVAVVRLGRHGDGAVQGVGEGDETLGDPAGLGQGEELLLGLLDLVARRDVRIALGGEGGDVAADADQVAPQRQVIDGAGVVGGVGRGRRAVHQVGQVADAAQLFEADIAGELLGQQDRLGQLALADIGLDRGEQPLVEGLEEVTGLQIVADPLEGGVVVEQGAQQRLFGLHVGRGMRDRHVVGDRAEIESGNKGHGLPNRPWPSG